MITFEIKKHMSTTEQKIEPPSSSLTLLQQAAHQIARLKRAGVGVDGREGGEGINVEIHRQSRRYSL